MRLRLVNGLQLLMGSLSSPDPAAYLMGAQEERGEHTHTCTHAQGELAMCGTEAETEATQL